MRPCWNTTSPALPDRETKFCKPVQLGSSMTSLELKGFRNSSHQMAKYSHKIPCTRHADMWIVLSGSHVLTYVLTISKITCLHKVPDDCPGGPVIHLGGAPWRSFDLELGTSNFHGLSAFKNRRLVRCALCSGADSLVGATSRCITL